jgi:hypothetical protein
VTCRDGATPNFCRRQAPIRQAVQACPCCDGHVDFCCLNIGAVISQIQGNKVKGVAVTTQKS